MVSSTSQQEFEQYRDEIHKLQRELEETLGSLDLALEEFKKRVLPVKRSALSSLADCTKLMYRHYKRKEALSEKEISGLKVLMMHILSQIIIDAADEELSHIFEELKRSETVVREGPQPGPPQKPSANEPNQESAFHEAVEKKKKKQELDPREKKELTAIYRQLVKILHPDLEQDPEKKLEKENLIKSLISAYENNDLDALLDLQKEYIGVPEENEELAVYNAVLKKQIEELQTAIQFAYRNPKYWPFHEYGTNSYEVLSGKIEEAFFSVKTHAESYRSIRESLESDEAEEALRALIAKAMHP